MVEVEEHLAATFAALAQKRPTQRDDCAALNSAERLGGDAVVLGEPVDSRIGSSVLGCSIG